MWRFWTAVAGVIALAITATGLGAVTLATTDTPAPCRLVHGELVTLDAVENGCDRGGQPAVLLVYDCDDGSTLAAVGPMGDPAGGAVLLVPDEGVWRDGDWTSLWSTCTSP